VFFGGGVEVVLPQRLFVNLRLSHFSKSGERVFVNDDEVFPLGIDMKVAMTPVEATVGYRFQPRGRKRNVIPYVGGGLGWHRYTEEPRTSPTPSENVSETFQGLPPPRRRGTADGPDLRDRRRRDNGRRFRTRSTVVSSSAADAFGESNLGGLAFRVRFVVGR
jgi:hypothetical protein